MSCLSNTELWGWTCLWILCIMKANPKRWGWKLIGVWWKSCRVTGWARMGGCLANGHFSIPPRHSQTGVLYASISFCNRCAFLIISKRSNECHEIIHQTFFQWIVERRNSRFNEMRRSELFERLALKKVRWTSLREEFLSAQISGKDLCWN